MAFFVDTWQSLHQWFWNSDVWLPPGFDWEDMKKNEKVKYAEFGDLIYPIPVALGLILIRFIVERAILYPFGVHLGIKNRPKPKVKPNPILEAAYRKNRKAIFSHKHLEALAKKTELEVRQVERWMRRRLNRDKPTVLTKFSESGWKFLFYAGNLLFGLFILWDKSWFWDINYCWYDFPHHSVTPDIWWYYMLGSGFYWSLMFSQFVDRQRKDFWQMFVHHCTTIALLGFSWTCNFTRVGTLVLILHDSADAFLEVAKMSKYANLDRVCDILFGLFTIVWIVTRLGIFPAYILNSTLIEAPKIVPMFSAYYIFNAMLSILLVLHGFWTYFICKVAFKALSTGKLENDQRSSSEAVTMSEWDSKEDVMEDPIASPKIKNKSH